MTPYDISMARDEAERLGLADSELLTLYSVDRTCRICNGIGPSWFPSTIRAAVDNLHPSLKTAAMIHDLAYYAGRGFKQANADFEHNGIALAKDYYGWYDPRRYLAIRKARQFRRLCDVLGMPAYMAAREERERDEEELKKTGEM